jgi:flagellum-specific ATP synthase
LRTDICSDKQVADGRVITRLMATYRKAEDMINIGAYAQGSNPEIDLAIVMHNHIDAFLRQAVAERQGLDASFAALHELAAKAG